MFYQANDLTSTVFYSTGWSLGEHQEWAKYSVFREATRVPLMVYIPGVTDSLSVYERRRQEIVEFVDLFPTLADFCGLEIPGKLCFILSCIVLDHVTIKYNFALVGAFSL